MSRYMDFNAWELIKKLLLNKEDVVNDLISTDIQKPLSANMGKELNENKISNVYINKDIDNPIYGIYTSIYPYMFQCRDDTNNLFIKVGNLKFNKNYMTKIDLSINSYSFMTELSISFFIYIGRNEFFQPCFISSNKKNKYQVHLCTDNNDNIYIFIAHFDGLAINYPSITINKVVCNFQIPERGTFENGWEWKTINDLNSYNRVTQCVELN